MRGGLPGRNPDRQPDHRAAESQSGAAAARAWPAIRRALRGIVATRGRVDPGALVLRVQGLRALVKLPRIVRLLLRGKINPLKTLFGIKTAAAEPRTPPARPEGSAAMRFAYYPGCSARSTCAELNVATHRVAAQARP